MNWEELQQSGATEIAGAVSGGLDLSLIHI